MIYPPEVTHIYGVQGSPPAVLSVIVDPFATALLVTWLGTRPRIGTAKRSYSEGPDAPTIRVVTYVGREKPTNDLVHRAAVVLSGGRVAGADFLRRFRPALPIQ